MAKKISVILAVVMLIICIFAGCSSVDVKTAIVGTWSGMEDDTAVVYVFNADGTGTAEAQDMVMDMTYSIKGAKITITLDTTGTVEDMLGMSIDELLAGGLVTQEQVDELIITDTVSFKIKGDTLTLGGYTYNKVN